MTELTLDEKKAIVLEKFGGLSAETMKRKDERGAFISVDDELQSVLIECGVEQFHGCTIVHRETGDIIRESLSHPLTKSAVEKRRAQRVKERNEERKREQAEQRANA